MYRRAIFPYCGIGSSRFDLKKKMILSVGCFWSHLKVEIAAGIALNWKSMKRVRKFYFFGYANACSSYSPVMVLQRGDNAEQSAKMGRPHKSAKICLKQYLKLQKC